MTYVLRAETRSKSSDDDSRFHRIQRQVQSTTSQCARTRYKRAESLNASAETWMSSGKKIYARRWRGKKKKKNKCMHAKGEPRRIERGPKGKEDVEKADGGRTRELKANKDKRKGTR